jgi:hypothetical protein
MLWLQPELIAVAINTSGQDTRFFSGKINRYGRYGQKDEKHENEYKKD